MSSTLTTSFHPQSICCSSLSYLHVFHTSAKRQLVCRGHIDYKVLSSTKMGRGSGFRGAVAPSSSRRGNNDEQEGAAAPSSSSSRWSGFAANDLHSFMNRLSKWLVAGLFGVFILWRHDAQVLWAAMGSVLNACLSITLKKILNQERPFSTFRSDPGMPSSHAQSFFYIIVFIILSMVKSQGVNELTLIIGGLILALASYLTWLRVSQRLHSPSQAIVGATVGSVFSILWFWSWDVFVLKAFLSFMWVRILLVLCALGSTLVYYFMRSKLEH